MRNIQKEESLKVLFVLDQKLKQIQNDATAKTQITSMSSLMMEIVKIFAPGGENLQQN